MAWRRRRGAWGARVVAWAAVVAAAALAALAAPRGADKDKRGRGSAWQSACGFAGAPPCPFRSRVRGAFADALDQLSAEPGDLDIFVPIIAPIALQDPQEQPHLIVLAPPPPPLLWLVEADMMPAEKLGKKAKAEHNLSIKSPARRRFFRRYFRRWMD
ncbi:hypothetical protein R5R35_006062 [Gryllus longicercus]|uniref:Accessory gland protein n=1 Tax=Gryllus longicercus TaxID=2509291 RepID=A0AAN9VYV0_9ORTH